MSLVSETLRMIGHVSDHSGIFYMHAKVHNPGNVGIRNACVQILIGDRRLPLRVLFDGQQGLFTWCIPAIHCVV